jgi:hypothetical protein
MGSCFSTTDWRIKDGQESAFTDRWITFLQWTQETHDGFESARLVIDEVAPASDTISWAFRDRQGRRP